MTGLRGGRAEVRESIFSDVPDVLTLRMVCIVQVVFFLTEQSLCIVELRSCPGYTDAYTVNTPPKVEDTCLDSVTARIQDNP